MPDLNLYCAPGWHPGGSGDNMQRLHANEFGAKLARYLLPQLFLEVWHEEITSDGIRVAYIPQEASNKNGPDIRVEIRPLFTLRRASRLPPMLAALQASLGELRDTLVRDFKTVQPQIDFELLFKFGSGGKLGDESGSWRSELPGP